MSELSIVILNAVFYLLFVIYSFKIKNSIFKLIAFIWLASAIMSIIYFLNPFNYLTNKITITPFVYLFTLFLIGVFPLKSLDNKLTSDKKLKCNKDLFNFLIIILSVCTIEPFLEILYFIFTKGVSELGSIYAEEKLEKGYRDTNHFSSIGKFLFSIIDYFKFVSIPLLFYYLSRGKNKYIIIGLIIASLTPTFNSLANGQRFLVMFLTFSYIFNYLLFRPYISKIRLNFIKKIGFLGGIGLGVVVFAISVSRFGEGTEYSAEGYGTLYQFVRYLGESFCNFNSYAFHLNKFLDGQNSWSSFYVYFTDNALDIEEKNRIIGIIVNIFYTHIGSFVLDYGLFWAFIILCLFALLNYLTVKSFLKNMKFGSIILINIYVNILLFGTTYFIYQNGSYHLLWAIVVALLINISTTKKRIHINTLR
jgi:oligosaccharide repeat unit polymerase